LKDRDAKDGINSDINMARDHDSNATATGTDDLLPTRPSLLGRLKDWRDDRSWQEFFDIYWRLIYGVARKAGLSPSEADEVVQETMLTVAKKMKDFHYDPVRGSFKGWLLQLTGWRITNQFNRRSAQGACNVTERSNGDESAEANAPGSDFVVPPELERLWDEEWEQKLMQAALDRVRGRVNPKQFQIYDFAVLQNKPVNDIRQFLDVSAAEVYLAKHRVGKLLRTELARVRKQLQ
jgi:RNA polymerase sigma-70 factor (ECF subfamily)